MPKYVRCPYFKYDKRTEIVCQAVKIVAHTSIAVNYYTYRYCCDPKNWYHCPFAEERRKVEEKERREGKQDG